MTDGISSGLLRHHLRAIPGYWQRYTVSPYESTASLSNRDAANFVQHLDRTLSRRKVKRPDPILLGGLNDPYPSAERKKRVTHRLLEVVAKHNLPLIVRTASTMVLRDIDILREIHQAQFTTLAFLLPAATERSLAKLAPHSPSLRDRLNAVDRIRRSGIETGIEIPSVTLNTRNRTEIIIGLLETAADLNLKFVILPDTAVGLVGRETPVRLARTYFEMAERLGVPIVPKRFTPSDTRRENYWVADHLWENAIKRYCFGLAFRPMRAAARKVNELRRDIRMLMMTEGIDGLSQSPEAIACLNDLLTGKWAATLGAN